MPTIDELYNKLVQSQEYIDGDLSLSCTETADYIWNDLMLKYDGYNDEMLMEFDNAAIELVTAYEKEGFYNGFRMAMQVLKGCLDSSN